MNRPETSAFTHFTEIAEARQLDVRRLQANMTRTAVRDLGATLRGLLRGAPRS